MTTLLQICLMTSIICILYLFFEVVSTKLKIGTLWLSDQL